MADARTIAVIGAGLMGHGIALSFARAGHMVLVCDPAADSLASLGDRIGASLRAIGAADKEVRSTLANVTGAGSIAEAVSEADFVFEAAPEKLDLKQKVFAEAEAAATDDCVFASNTSVIPITAIMGGLTNRARALGTHWWNPPHMIPLVEVIRTEWTTEAAFDSVTALLAQIGKTPVRVDKDVPGFIGNRLQHALWREAISLVEHGICSAEAVDAVVKASFGRRLAVLGPLENADLVGTDLTLDIHENVLADLETSPAPSPYLRQLVDTDRLGMKSGEGFQAWPPGQAAETSDRVARHLLKLETILD